MMEEVLLQYGAMGAMLLFLMSLTIFLIKKVSTSVDNNTIAMTKVYEIMLHCTKK